MFDWARTCKACCNLPGTLPSSMSSGSSLKLNANSDGTLQMLSLILSMQLLMSSSQSPDLFRRCFGFTSFAALCSVSSVFNNVGLVGETVSGDFPQSSLYTNFEHSSSNSVDRISLLGALFFFGGQASV